MTTDSPMVGTIPTPLGERGTAFSPRWRLVIKPRSGRKRGTPSNSMGENLKQVAMASASESVREPSSVVTSQNELTQVAESQSGAWSKMDKDRGRHIHP